MSRIGEYISQRRLEKNITQKQLAEMLHVSSSAVSKWENGVAVPHISCFAQIAEALDVPIEELYMLTREDLGEDLSRKNAPVGDAVADGTTAEDTSPAYPDVDDEVVTNKNKDKKVRLSTLYKVAALSVLCTAAIIMLAIYLPKPAVNVKSGEPTLEVIDEYFKDDEDYYGYSKIYYVAIVYDGELTDEMVLLFDTMIREKYPNIFDKAELLIALVYNDLSDYESNAQPKQKMTLMPKSEGMMQMYH